jgi:hypothetical protein
MSVRFSALLVVGFLTTSPHCFGREVDKGPTRLSPISHPRAITRNE